MPSLVSTLEPVTNRETWIEAFQFIDQETGETIDLIDPDTEAALIDSATVTIREQGTRGQVLSGTLADGTIALLADGVLQIEFSVTQMGSLCNKTYDIGAVLTKDGQTVEFLLGTLPVLDGIVSS